MNFQIKIGKSQLIRKHVLKAISFLTVIFETAVVRETAWWWDELFWISLTNRLLKASNYHSLYTYPYLIGHGTSCGKPKYVDKSMPWCQLVNCIELSFSLRFFLREPMSLNDTVVFSHDNHCWSYQSGKHTARHSRSIW